MKLLVLGYEYPPIGGGTGQALERLLRVLASRRGWEIEVWTAKPPKGTAARTPPRGVELVEFACGKKRPHYWTFGEQLSLLWKAYRKTLADDPFPDAVLVWGGLPLGMLLLGELGSLPSIVALRGSDVPGFNGRTSGFLYKTLARLVWRRASLVTTNSPALASLARETRPRTKLEIIPNGVNEFPSVGDVPFREVGEYDEFRVLSVNRLVRRKRVDWLLQAVAGLPPDFRNRVRVIVAGDGPERYRLEPMARELALEDRVEFLGEVPQRALQLLYRESDLFALTSSAEGLSNSLLEAMSFGLPCLQASPTGFSDIDAAVPPPQQTGTVHPTHPSAHARRRTKSRGG